MHDSHIFADLRISKTGLSNLITGFIANWPERQFKTDGYSLEIQDFDTIMPVISAHDKSIYAEIPVSYTFIKPAGLFSIEGEGKISIRVRFDFDILQNFEVQIESILEGYHWLNEPVLKVGKLDIPIEILTNCLIHHVKEGMLDEMDAFIEKNVNILALIREQINNYGQNYLITNTPPLFLNLTLYDVLAGKLVQNEADIHLDLLLHVTTKISDEPIKSEAIFNPSFYWINDKPNSHTQNTDIEFSYYGLARIIMNALNGKDIGGKTFDIENILIRNTSILELVAAINGPVKGIVTITGHPYLNKTDQKIHIDDMRVVIDAKNLIYKLSSPIIEKMIRNKLEGFFPLEVAPLFENYIKKIPTFNFLNNKISLTPGMAKVHIDNLIFSENQIITTLNIDQAELGIVLQHS
ncbi:MAG: DUF4403 family protein [Saprospiraceae bacterium]|nr:DUF4403 family protein [Saprospiraceae bacterium]